MECFNDSPAVQATAGAIISDRVEGVNAVLEKAGVGVAPGVDFGQAGKRAVRFSYASSEENIREAARQLREYLGRRWL